MRKIKNPKISQLEHATWLNNLASCISLYSLLNSKVFFNWNLSSLFEPGDKLINHNSYFINPYCRLWDLVSLLRLMAFILCPEAINSGWKKLSLHLIVQTSLVSRRYINWNSNLNRGKIVPINFNLHAITFLVSKP